MRVQVLELKEEVDSEKARSKEERKRMVFEMQKHVDEVSSRIESSHREQVVMR